MKDGDLIKGVIAGTLEARVIYNGAWVGGAGVS